MKPLDSRPSILHILEATSAGAARYTADILLNIDTSRFDVSFAYSLLRSDPRFTDDLEKMRSRGIRLIDIPMERNIRPCRDLVAFARLFRVMRKNRFDVVHCHSSKAGFLGRLAAKLASPKTVTIYSPHAIAVSVDRIYWWLEKIAALFTDCLLGVSESEQRQLAALNLVPGGKLHHVTAAIDVNSFNASLTTQRFAIEPGTLLIGSAGRLADQKDPLTFLRMAKIVLDKGFPAKFIWAGDGELRDHAAQEAKDLGIRDHVIFAGYSPDLRPFLASLDIFTLTSLYESFGYVTCEAMAFGKPVVGTNVPGTNELILEGRTGFLAEPRRPEELADRVCQLLSDPELRLRMGEAGRVRAESHYSLPRMLRQIEDLYSGMTSPTRPASVAALRQSNPIT